MLLPWIRLWFESNGVTVTEQDVYERCLKMFSKHERLNWVTLTAARTARKFFYIYNIVLNLKLEERSVTIVLFAKKIPHSYNPHCTRKIFGLSVRRCRNSNIYELINWQIVYAHPHFADDVIVFFTQITKNKIIDHCDFCNIKRSEHGYKCPLRTQDAVSSQDEHIG